jgi:ABC-2 type transport system ATP-binding protein
MLSPMLRLENLVKRFGDRAAVDGLTLHIRKGEMFGLLGPNGAGKTTTISMAVGLLRPDAGTVELEGCGDPSRPQARRHIGIAPQSLAVYAELTAAENLRFFGSIYGMGGPALSARVSELLGLVGLSDRAHQRIGTFSGGMKRRINLASALVHDPPLILLDEPTVGVDPQSRNAIFEILRSLKARGKTVVYTTHYMEEAQKLCDRVGIIDHGKLLALDSVEALIRGHGGSSAVVAEFDGAVHRVQTDDPVREISAWLKRGDARNLRVERPDLETVFLALTGRSLRD